MFQVDTATPIDVLEQQLLAREALIARLRSEQARVLRELDAAQVASSDGCRSMLEWTMARLDVTDTTARDLLRLSNAATDHPQLAAELGDGVASFDRTVATLRLAASGADPALIDASWGFDLSGVARLATRRHRMTRSDEHRGFSDRYVACQPTLDGSAGRVWGQLPGYEYRAVEKALYARSDEFDSLTGPALSRGQRMADALVAMAQDSLDGSGRDGRTPISSVPLVTVFADGDRADASNGETDAEIEFGPKVGPATLERILCAGRVQVVGLHDGSPVVASQASRAITPAIRRCVAWRDGGCTIDGCRSRYRLEPHHVVHRADDGNHDPDNLTTLCWYHHHVVIHGMGYAIDPHTSPQRRRFLPALDRRGADPP